MSRKQDYFVRFDNITGDEELELVEIDTRTVGAAIRAIDGIKAVSFWADATAAQEAEGRLNLLIERLLTPVTDRLINEVRATRDGDATPLTMRDPKLNPYSLPLTTLADIEAQLIGPDGGYAGLYMEQIRNLLQQSNLTDDQMLVGILRIVAVLAP